MKYLKFIFLVIVLFPFKVFAYTKAVIDVTSMSLTEIKEALDKGFTTSETLVQLYLDRIEEYNDDFNAINQLNENALEDAKVLDQERLEGNIRGPLHGIPILVKTNIDVEGLATTAGSKALSYNYPKDDAYIIEKLKDSGAIILGSTNMSEFAFSAQNSYSSYGNVRNAFNTEYTPYGSSGGSAASIALSFASAALGTDTNSSVRLPASAAGLVGIRPSLGLVSRTGIIPYDINRDTAGVLTKTVEDNALILSIIAGTDENDDKTKDAIVKDYTDLDYDISDIKIGVIESYVEGSSSGTGANSLTNSDIKDLTNEKIELMKENGANIVYIDQLLSSYYLNIAGSTVSGITFCDGFNDYIKGTTGTIRSFEDLAKSSGKVYSLSGYLTGCGGTWISGMTTKNEKKASFEEHVLSVMEEYDIDVLLYPSAKEKISKISNIISPNSPGNSLGSVIGYPSITVPMGYIEGFPYGIEFFSTKYNEDVLYAVAEFFESINKLDITNSPLAPNLYTIPDCVNELKEVYLNNYDDENYSEMTSKTKEYFKSYSDKEDEEALEEAQNLIRDYENREIEIERVALLNKIKKFVLYVIYVVLGFILIFIIIKKVFRNRNKKKKYTGRKKYSAFDKCKKI